MVIPNELGRSPSLPELIGPAETLDTGLSVPDLPKLGTAGHCADYETLAILAGYTVVGLAAGL